jgi:hypothetical protein
MKKTNEEIEALKENWKRDPVWDIEDTKGFEEHREELIAYRKELEIEYQRNEEERIARRARIVEIDTGVALSGAAQAIETFAEIENEVERAINKTESSTDYLLAAQVRAILLLAAQVQRMAQALEAGNDNDQVDFMTRLYKVTE